MEQMCARVQGGGGLVLYVGAALQLAQDGGDVAAADAAQLVLQLADCMVDSRRFV